MGSLEIDYKQIVLENVTSTFVIIKFMNAQTLKVLVNTASVGAKTIFVNKLAKARKMRKPPGTLGLKKFRPGKFGVKKVWAQHIEKVEIN